MENVIDEGLQNEIRQARAELELAETAFSLADPRYVDAANYRVLACRERLNVLYAEARNGGRPVA
ncbi:hypothetical protein LLE49_19380 [Alicyclobacillus tolerans]|uniref:hypothetical protein n=1 Tax=Alicyclobacillus tolerans TaxID=90970 RepID=UPI001F3E1D9A|nr:hypothetical protein [Alicyclobacillus tolerans]MCF8566884.1 hypothetical protein [Alicyclobacillus tolerans]